MERRPTMRDGSVIRYRGKFVSIRELELERELEREAARVL
jgi:hypothetical protein